MINVAINGFGRIGRNILRALYERPDVASRLRVVAINDLGTPEINAHLLQFDTTHGRFGATVSVEDGALNIDGDRIAVFAERNPEDLPWGDLKVDVVFECTGIFTSRDKASAHLRAGARKVLISAPSGDADATVVDLCSGVGFSPSLYSGCVSEEMMYPACPASDELRADREVVLAAVRQNGSALEWAAGISAADSIWLRWKRRASPSASANASSSSRAALPVGSSTGSSIAGCRMSSRRVCERPAPLTAIWPRGVPWGLHPHSLDLGRVGACRSDLRGRSRRDRPADASAARRAARPAAARRDGRRRILVDGLCCGCRAGQEGSCEAEQAGVFNLLGWRSTASPFIFQFQYGYTTFYSVLFT